MASKFDTVTAPWRAELVALIVRLIPQIGDEYRATDDSEDSTPGMGLTVSTDDELTGWNFQTGDNSFTGGCYGHAYWAVSAVYRDTNPESLADELLAELGETWAGNPDNVDEMPEPPATPPETDGCGAVGPEGYRCTHHTEDFHVARGTEPDSFAEEWPIAATPPAGTQITVKSGELMTCADCYLMHETGEEPEADPRWSLAEYEAECARLTAQGLQIVSGDSEKDNEFSREDCGLCGSGLGGSRHHLALLGSVDIGPHSHAWLTDVQSGYFECALWSTSATCPKCEGESGEEECEFCGGLGELDNLEGYDIAANDEAAMRDDCAQFVAQVVAAGLDLGEMSAGQFGHDYWLTRNGHGAGFWDRGLGKLGDELTKLAKADGSEDLYLDSDGLVHKM